MVISVNVQNLSQDLTVKMSNKVSINLRSTCVDRVNGYICQCPESVSGPNCENEQQSEY